MQRSSNPPGPKISSIVGFSPVLAVPSVSSAPLAFGVSSTSCAASADAVAAPGPLRATLRVVAVSSSSSGTYSRPGRAASSAVARTRPVLPALFATRACPVRINPRIRNDNTLFLSIRLFAAAYSSLWRLSNAPRFSHSPATLLALNYLRGVFQIAPILGGCRRPTVGYP